MHSTLYEFLRGGLSTPDTPLSSFLMDLGDPGKPSQLLALQEPLWHCRGFPLEHGGSPNSHLMLGDHPQTKPPSPGQRAPAASLQRPEVESHQCPFETWPSSPLSC